MALGQRERTSEPHAGSWSVCLGTQAASTHLSLTMLEPNSARTYNPTVGREDGHFAKETATPTGMLS